MENECWRAKIKTICAGKFSAHSNHQGTRARREQSHKVQAVRLSSLLHVPSLCRVLYCLLGLPCLPLSSLASPHSMTVSNSKDDGGSSPYRSVRNYWERLAVSNFSIDERHQSNQHITMPSKLEKSVKAPDELVKSPDNVTTPRLGITPPTVSSAGSTPRHISISYRRRVESRERHKKYGDASPNGQPLDPVVLSFDKPEEVSSESEDELELIAKSCRKTLVANRSQRLCELNASNTTVLTSNKSPLAQSFSADDDYDDAGSSDGSEFSPQGPGLLYLQVLRKHLPPQPHIPTPPRRRDAVTTSNNMLDEGDSVSEASSSFDIPVPAKVSNSSGEFLGTVDLERSGGEGDEVQEESPGKPDSTLEPNRFRCGPLLLASVLILMISIFLIVLLAAKSQSSLVNEENDKAPTLFTSNSPTVSPTLSPVRMHKTSPPVSSPTIAPVPSVQKGSSTATPTETPTWDPVKEARLNEAVRLFSSWGRFELWNDSRTPQAKALYWWISDTDWDLYSDDRKIQRYALAVFFFATEGTDSWTESVNWLTTAHECTWFSSSLQAPCGGDGPANDTVRILHLEQNNLQGFLPAEVALLTGLAEIRLVGNSVRGLVPQEWTQLLDLRVLELRDNELDGEINFEGLSAWSQLQILDLSENRIRGPLPVSFAELGSSLNSLLLGFNEFSGPLPPSWSGLGNLRVLSLEENNLTGGIPSTYGGLLELRELHVGSNFLDDWNPSAWQFLSLEVLDLRSNQLGVGGTIPESLYTMQSVQIVRLSNNNITQGLPDLIGSLVRLSELDLSDNLFEGELPRTLGDNLQELRILKLQQNSFTGEVPRSVERLRRLELLRLDGNNFLVVDNVCRGIEDTLIEFYADCAGDSGLSCPCCTHCCDGESLCFEV